MVPAIVVGAVIVIALVFGGIRLFSALTGTQDDGTSGEVTVTVPSGAGTSDISSRLLKAGVIDDAQAFTDYVIEQGAENSLKPGTYMMTVGEDFADILHQLTTGSGTTDVTLTIPEGYTASQVASKVEETCGIPYDDFMALVNSADAYATEFPFVADAYDNSLEGFLFPKTYTVPQNATADDVIRMMLTQFQTETASLDLTYPESKGYSLYDVVIMASCVEKEAYFDEDRAHIASVLYNRLDTDMTLGLDVTVSYVVGKPGSELTSDDLAIDSPYNTYVYKGLPAGPICSPRLASLEAVCSPLETGDYYFILTEDYSNFYADYDSFLAGKQEYQSQS
jgi:UPF0755 protein